MTSGPVVAAHRARVEAGLECFAARRMIDAGRYATAPLYGGPPG